ncbi:MAG TPA: stage III sporulation protein D [Clostridiales bacterium UBA8153]|nr:stage III sporulation protein D [Clostridiales bacterium UBA8153]
MNDAIWTQAANTGERICKTKATGGDMPGTFGVSKSTVHKDVTERLPRIQPQPARAIKAVLEYNQVERHLRGGEATRKQYQEPDVVNGGWPHPV